MAGSVSIQGTASDTNGVVRVVLQVDGEARAETTQAAFQFLWDAQAGTHTLTVVAYDAAGNAGVAWTRVVVRP